MASRFVLARGAQSAKPHKTRACGAKQIVNSSAPAAGAQNPHGKPVTSTTQSRRGRNSHESLVAFTIRSRFVIRDCYSRPLLIQPSVARTLLLPFLLVVRLSACSHRFKLVWCGLCYAQTRPSTRTTTSLVPLNLACHSPLTSLLSLLAPSTLLYSQLRLGEAI